MLISSKDTVGYFLYLNFYQRDTNVPINFLKTFSTNSWKYCAPKVNIKTTNTWRTKHSACEHSLCYRCRTHGLSVPDPLHTSRQLMLFKALCWTADNKSVLAVYKTPGGAWFRHNKRQTEYNKARFTLLCWIIDSAWGLWQINCSIDKTIFFCAFMHTAYPMATSSVLDCHNLCINVSNQHFLVLNL